MSAVHPRSPEEVLGELLAAVRIDSICIPAPVRAAHPELARIAEASGALLTRRPEGDESLVCLLAEHSDGARVETVIERFERAPFVLLVAGEDDPGAAVALAGERLLGTGGWLASGIRAERGAVLLADEQRLLEAAKLPGEWDAAPPLSGGLETEQEVLTALWAANERDQRSLDALAARIRRDADELEQAQAERERLTGEASRLRAAERREADRARMMLLEERAWVAEQALRLAGSRSWRIGHALVRAGRRLAFKSDRGTNLPAMIVERLDQRDLP